MGATLLQEGQPVAFASRPLSTVERQYAQIEKECLAIVFACSRFNQYLHGRELTTVETDHKTLVPIFQKSIHSAPKRLQRILLRLQRYNLNVTYLPGSQMYVADMLSRAYAQIEKECLAIVFACSRFNQYLHGRELTTVETDHKTLVPIFQKSIH